MARPVMDGDGTKIYSVARVCLLRWYSRAVLKKNFIGGGFHEGISMFKSGLDHKKIKWSNREFFIPKKLLESPLI